MEEPKCSECPNAKHGFDRNASHNAGRYVCECESHVCGAEQLRQRVAELENEIKQLRDLQYKLMRSGALVAIEKCKNATGQRRVIDMYVSANQIAEDLLNAMDSGA